MIEFNHKYGNNPGWPTGESWVLGDSAAIGLLLDEHDFFFHEEIAPRINDDMTYAHVGAGPKIRVYNQVDSHFVLEDMYAKLLIHST